MWRGRPARVFGAARLKKESRAARSFENVPTRDRLPSTRTNSLRVPQNCANQFDHACGDPEKESDDTDPRGVQPAIEGRAGEPSHNRAGWQHQGKLAIAPDLYPWILFLLRAAVVGRRRGRHRWVSTQP